MAAELTIIMRGLRVRVAKITYSPQKMVGATQKLAHIKLAFHTELSDFADFLDIESLYLYNNNIIPSVIKGTSENRIGSNIGGSALGSISCNLRIVSELLI